MKRFLLLLGLAACLQSEASASDPTLERVVTALEPLEGRISALEGRSPSYTPSYTPTYTPASYGGAQVRQASYVRPVSNYDTVGSSTSDALMNGEFTYSGYRVVFYIYRQ